MNKQYYRYDSLIGGEVIFYKSSNSFIIVKSEDETTWKSGSDNGGSYFRDWIEPYCKRIRNKHEIQQLDKRRILLGVY